MWTNDSSTGNAPPEALLLCWLEEHVMGLITWNIIQFLIIVLWNIGRKGVNTN
jgi:hypothetical protein